MNDSGFHRGGNEVVPFTVVHNSAELLLAVVVQHALAGPFPNSADDLQRSAPVSHLAGCEITQKEYRISLGSRSSQTANTAK